MGNSGQPKYRPILKWLAEHPDPVIQEHARWAVNRLSQPKGVGDLGKTQQAFDSQEPERGRPGPSNAPVDR
ncbi:MAG: hypothetical protein HY647_02110 [Acidobacteria bacterium]|nr:hypothetical protein [Acidobacteriota bacterium]